METLESEAPPFIAVQGSARISAGREPHTDAHTGGIQQHLL